MSFVQRFHGVLVQNSWRQFATKARQKIDSKKNEYSQLFPKKILHRKHKTPNQFYLANEKIAHTIDQHLDQYFQETPCDTIMEINPGVGYFTRKLIDREDKFKKIILVESMDFFLPNLEELHTQYPDRVKVQQADFINISKLVYMDKIDNGSRLEELLRNVPRKSLSDKGENRKI